MTVINLFFNVGSKEIINTDIRNINGEIFSRNQENELADILPKR